MGWLTQHNVNIIAKGLNVSGNDLEIENNVRDIFVGDESGGKGDNWE